MDVTVKNDGGEISCEDLHDLMANIIKEYTEKIWTWGDRKYPEENHIDGKCKRCGFVARYSK